MFRPGALLELAVLAALVAICGCASTGSVPRPFPSPAGGPSVPAGNPGRSVPAPGVPAAEPLDTYALVGTALSLRGSPYRNGGNAPDGFDCSGFVWYVFAQHGVRIPRTVTDQFASAPEVSSDSLAAGDLVFFNTKDDTGSVSHVGLAIGGDAFVHAPSSRGEVRVERLSTPYWAKRFLGARRIR